MHGWGVESPRLTIDSKVAQAAGEVAPGLHLPGASPIGYGNFLALLNCGRMRRYEKGAGALKCRKGVPSSNKTQIRLTI